MTRRAALARHEAACEAKALRDAAEHVTEIDGRHDDRAADWLNSRAARIEQVQEARA